MEEIGPQPLYLSNLECLRVQCKQKSNGESDLFEKCDANLIQMKWKTIRSKCLTDIYFIPNTVYESVDDYLSRKYHLGIDYWTVNNPSGNCPVTALVLCMCTLWLDVNYGPKYLDSYMCIVQHVAIANFILLILTFILRWKLKNIRKYAGKV